jgi:hypothetical protein
LEQSSRLDRALSLALGLLLLFGSIVGFAPLVTAPRTEAANRQGGQSWGPSAEDTNVRSANPDAPNGGALALEASLDFVGLGRQESVIFLKFDLGAYGEDMVINYAELRITVRTDMPYTDGLLIGAYACSTNDWSENSLTWNNAPWSAVSAQKLSIDRGGHPNNEYVFSVTGAMNHAYPALTWVVVTVVLRAEEEGTVYFWPREQGNWSLSPTLFCLFNYPTEGGDAIDTSQEFASGFTPDEGFWYAWVNLQGAQLIYLVAVSSLGATSYPHANFIGQHFFAADGTELFIGHTLMLFELFNDTNHNGILDADFQEETAETVYYMNASEAEAFAPQSIEKVLIDNTWHYQWSVRYDNVSGCLIYSQGPRYGDVGIFVRVASLEMEYDYCLVNNATYLKTGLHLGDVIESWGIDENATFSGLGLTALYSTLLLASSDQVHVLVGGGEYDSGMPGQPTLSMNTATVAGAGASFYELVFGQSYTLYSGGPTVLDAFSSACPWMSVNPLTYESYVKQPLYSFQAFLNIFLPRISSLPIVVNYNYQESSLLFRVNYPSWDGYELVHDPLYVAYLGARPGGTPLWPALALAVGIFGVIALSLSIVELRRVRRGKENVAPF